MRRAQPLYPARGQGCEQVAWVASVNRSQTALIRAMVGSLARSRKRIMQLLRFIRPVYISSRYA